VSCRGHAQRSVICLLEDYAHDLAGAAGVHKQEPIVCVDRQGVRRQSKVLSKSEGYVMRWCACCRCQRSTVSVWQTVLRSGPAQGFGGRNMKLLSLVKRTIWPVRQVYMNRNQSSAWRGRGYGGRAMQKM
jgi:hypothetical protein